jgi:hypothetical protein
MEKPVKEKGNTCSLAWQRIPNDEAGLQGCSRGSENRPAAWAVASEAKLCCWLRRQGNKLATKRTERAQAKHLDYF